MSIVERIKEFFGISANLVTEENMKKLLDRWFPEEDEWEEEE